MYGGKCEATTPLHVHKTNAGFVRGANGFASVDLTFAVKTAVRMGTYFLRT